MITVIYGPPGSGKTTNKDFLKRKFAARRIIDDYYIGSVIIHTGDLVLCQSKQQAETIAADHSHVQIFHIAEALRK